MKFPVFLLFVLLFWQEFLANAISIRDPGAAFRGGLHPWRRAQTKKFACQSDLAFSQTVLLNAERDAAGAASLFAKLLQKEVTAFTDALVRWACVTPDSDAVEESENAPPWQLVYRFHSTVTELFAVVEVIENLVSPALQESPEGIDHLAETEGQFQHFSNRNAQNISRVQRMRIQQKNGAQNSGIKKRLSRSPSVPLSPPTVSNTRKRKSPPQPTEVEENGKRNLDVATEHQRVTLCDLSIQWNITDWQDRCAYGAPITNAWEGVGYNSAQQAITALTLSGKSIQGELPHAFSDLTALEHLQLSNNAITGALGTSLFRLSYLTVLDLARNLLTGTISRDISNLSALQYLELQSNRIGGNVPPDVAALTALIRLSLFNNRLNGVIPSSLSALTAMEVLSLYNNFLSGTIPRELSSLAAMKSLSLSTNRLTGTIPKDFSSLVELKQLSLFSNQLRGTIPVKLSTLASLTNLALSNNQLSGTIPGNLSSLASLEHLWLHNNQLSGPIPRGVGSLTALRTLYLRDNQLRGTIPKELGYLIALNELSLYGNQISGVIPRELGSLTALKGLYLYGNKLSGAIPKELSRLTALLFFHGSSNMLTGAIPRELSKLTALKFLALSRNKLSDSIDHLGTLTALTYLALDTNELRGTIPEELSAMRELTGLGLSHNQLSGPIPAELSTLTALELLRLEANQLNGTIPRELERLTALTALFLFANQLSGTIPGQLQTLTALKELSLHTNPLSGVVPLALSSLSSLSRLELQDTEFRGVALGLHHWLNGLKIFDASGTPMIKPSCGGFPDVLYDASLHLCVTSNFMPNTEYGCSGIASLNASPAFPVGGTGITRIPPVDKASSLFHQFSVPLSCRYSLDYELLFTVQIHSAPSSGGPQPGMGHDEPREFKWPSWNRLLLNDATAFLGDVSVLLPMWGEVAWEFLASRHDLDMGADVHVALEMRAAAQSGASWYTNASIPRVVLSALAMHAAMMETSVNDHTVLLRPCPSTDAIFDALESACPYPGPCFPILLNGSADAASCPEEQPPALLPPAQQTRQLEITSVTFSMHAKQPLPTPPRPDPWTETTCAACLIVGSQPLQRALPIVRPMVSISNLSALETQVLPRHVHCVPLSAANATESAAMVMYGEVLLPHEQSVLSFTNRTTAVLDTFGLWPVGASLVSMWPSGRISHRGKQLGPSFSKFSPMSTPVLLSLALITNPIAESLRISIWVHGMYHATIQFSGLGPGYLFNTHICLANTHPNDVAVSQWHSLEDAVYEHSAARLLGGDDLLPIRTERETQFVKLPWRDAEARLWSQLSLPEAVAASLSQIERRDSDTWKTLPGSMGLTLKNVEANFTGLVFHCYLRQPSPWARGKGTACLSIAAGSHILFLNSTFILHPPRQNSTAFGPEGGPQLPLPYHSLVFVYNAVVSFVNCRFIVATAQGDAATWSHWTQHPAFVPVFLRSAYNNKLQRTDCHSLYRHEWWRNAPPVLGLSRQQQCIDFLSQEQNETEHPRLHHISRAFPRHSFVISCEACHFHAPEGWMGAAILARGPFLLRRSSLGFTNTSSGGRGVGMVQVEKMHNWNTGFGAVLLSATPAKDPVTLQPGDTNTANLYNNTAALFQGWSLNGVRWSQEGNFTTSSLGSRLFLHDCALQVPVFNEEMNRPSSIVIGPASLWNITLLPLLPGNESGDTFPMLGYLTGIQMSSLELRAVPTPCGEWVPGSRENNGSTCIILRLKGVVANEGLLSAMISFVSFMDLIIGGMASDKTRPLPVRWDIDSGILLLPVPDSVRQLMLPDSPIHLTWEVASLTWSARQASLLAILDEDSGFRLTTSSVRDSDKQVMPPALREEVAAELAHTFGHLSWSHVGLIAPLTMLVFPGSCATLNDVTFRDTTSSTPAIMILGLSQEWKEATRKTTRTNPSSGLHALAATVTLSRTYFLDNTYGGLVVRQESSSLRLICLVQDAVFLRNMVATSGGGALSASHTATRRVIRRRTRRAYHEFGLS